MRNPSARRALPGLIALIVALFLPGTSGRAQDAIEVRDIEAGALRVHAFRLEQPATVRIDAVGAEAGGLNRFLRARNAVARFITRVLDKDPPRFDSGWSATAWLLDADSREVLWRLDTSETRMFDNGLHRFEGDIELPAGTYEVYYASFPDVGWRGPDGPGWEYDRDAASRLRLRISGDDVQLTAVDPEVVHRAFDAASVVSLGRDSEELHERVAFDVARDTDIEIYMVGEASRNRSYDHGWVIDADTREPVWSFDWLRSQPAGGTARNRVLREHITLPAGRYAAFFAKDRSHGPGAWRSLPPGDPAGWGLSIRPVSAADRGAFTTYAYEPVPTRDAIVSLTRVGDDAAVSQGFTLARDLDVRVFAIGEGRERRMFDYAWIANAHTFEPVWTMEYENTRHAGGTSKNREFDGVIHLPAGSYVVHYITDDSHSYGDWNGSAPIDAEFWGVTILPAAGPLDTDAVKPYDEADDPAIVASITRVTDSRQVRRSFTLEEEMDVRIYAVGEGTNGQMSDYARILDVEGREVWRMRYEDTDHAGGSSKNRSINRVIRLAPGRYELIYRTDDSHAWGDWNSTPPTDARNWGVTLRRER